MVLTPFWTWYQSYTPTLPNLYWDVNTREQQLKLMCDAIDALGAYADELGKGVNANVEKLEELEAQFDAFVASGFNDYYRAQIKAWIADNLKYIYQQTITHVFFGVSTDGHLIAYIPTSWAEIAFSTGYDYSLDTYGRLILRWKADAPYSAVDQTPEVVRYLSPTVPDPSAVGQTVATLDGVAWSLLDAGTDGQVMTLADGVPSWADMPEEVPSAVAGAIIAGTSDGWAVLAAGEAGQILMVADGTPIWVDVPVELPEAAAGALLLGTSDGWTVLDAPDAAATLSFDGSDVEWSTRVERNVLIGNVTKTSVASVTDAWPSKLLGLTAYGNSTQASTPTPAVPVAIKSVAGVSAVTSDGTTDTTYALSLTDSDGVAHVMRSLPDGTADTLALAEDGTGGMTEWVASVVLDGTGNYSAVQDNEHAFSKTIKPNFPEGTSLSAMNSDFAYSNVSAASLTDGQFTTWRNWQGYLAAAFCISSCSTVAEFKTWLTTHPQTLFFAADAPATFTIPAVTMPALPATASSARLSATDEDSAAIAASVAIEYERDVTKVIADLESRISTLEG